MKDRIDHSNYEAWLLDRLDGTLTDAQERLLDAFLHQHSELVPDEGELPTVRNERSSPVHFDKETLKRQVPPLGPIAEHNVLDHLIARAEGDLDPEQERSLGAYLEAHPHHQRDARIVDFTRTGHQPVSFKDKSVLYRQVPPVGMPDAYHIDDFLIARAEGDLDAHQEAALAAYLAANFEAQRAWRTVQLAKVQANTMIYPDKAGLKKGGRVIAFTSRTWVRLSAAASILLVLGMGLWFLRTPPTSNTLTAEVSGQVNGTGPEADDLVGERPGSAQHEASMSIAENGAGTAIARTVEESEGAQQDVDNGPSSPRNARTTMPRMQRVDPVPPIDLGTPVSVEVAEVPVSSEDPAIGSEPPTRTTQAMTVPELLASTLRERVLEKPASQPRPLDKDDAVAMVDRGLKAVGGDDAGLDMERGEAGRLRSFNLRLGRNLAISAQR